jgi:putative transposase
LYGIFVLLKGDFKMPNTYTQIHLQVVFAVKYRLALISSEWENRLYQYITGVVRKLGHKLLVINGMPDHLHLLVGLKPDQALSDLMRVVKGESSEWINQVAGRVWSVFLQQGRFTCNL